MSCCPSNKQTQGGNKLRMYKLIKNDYKMETYIYYISDHDVRRDLTKLRCSNHSLLIEQGRYSKLEVAERLCKKCNKIEDKIHFLIECKLYDSMRKKFFSDNNVISIDGNTKDKFIYSLKNRDKNFILNVAKFTTAFVELKKIFSNCIVI